MEPKYVFAIAAGSLFLLLFIIYLFSFSSRRKKKAELKRRLDLAYAPKNLKKMDYDLAYYDEEAAKRILNGKIAEEKQVTIEDILAPFEKSDLQNSSGDDGEGEELVGKYKPE